MGRLRWHRGRQEHPRVRGENGVNNGGGEGDSGTSPRARGKLSRFRCCTRKIRNIPACAGKTGAVGFCWSVAEEHPRVRGENTRIQRCYQTKHGTSPRARGKLRDQSNFLPPRGNIPACAGKTGDSRVHDVRLEEHPRVRGENTGMTSTTHTAIGTSPRARGKRGRKRRGQSTVRNIPACAGKTPMSTPPRDPQWEHPRVRGENVDLTEMMFSHVGTSPRARGKQV